jgi:hypothetical protein
LSTTVEAPNLNELDVPISETAPNPTANFNDAPPPLPELYDEAGRKQIPYIVQLMLGSNGIKKETYDVKDDNGDKTGEVKAYFTADILAKVIEPFDQRELNLARFDSFLRPAQRWTSFVPASKEISEIGHLAQLVGLNVNDYQTVGQMVPDLVTALKSRGENAVQVKAFIQWQWYDKDHTYVTNSGKEVKGAVVKRGMRQADEVGPDGYPNPVITNPATGNQIRARATITRLEPLQ